MNYWIMKSEPSVYSISDLKKNGKTGWDGVRNYQARNFMRDKMKKGDMVLFYHSNAAPSGIAGIARIAREAYPDHSAWDKKDKHYDPRSTKENPVWMMVDVEYVKTFQYIIPLEVLKKKKQFDGMLVTKRGSRLSVQPVEEKHYDEVIRLGKS